MVARSPQGAMSRFLRVGGWLEGACKLSETIQQFGARGGGGGGILQVSERCTGAMNLGRFASRKLSLRHPAGLYMVYACRKNY